MSNTFVRLTIAVFAFWSTMFNKIFSNGSLYSQPKCFLCGSRFSRKCDLNRHTKNHSGERKWFATRCFHKNLNWSAIWSATLEKRHINLCVVQSKYIVHISDTQPYHQKPTKTQLNTQHKQKKKKHKRIVAAGVLMDLGSKLYKYNRKTIYSSSMSSKHYIHHRHYNRLVSEQTKKWIFRAMLAVCIREAIRFWMRRAFDEILSFKRCILFQRFPIMAFAKILKNYYIVPNKRRMFVFTLNLALSV